MLGPLLLATVSLVVLIDGGVLLRADFYIVCLLGRL